mmetsp:Transcript_18596/g.62616  ORF Transcript_18596/g.62616 Transcript_18596/m.62616 type:complete len:212 (-) Transcript_18596:3363-3998(-)
MLSWGQLHGELRVVPGGERRELVLRHNLVGCGLHLSSHLRRNLLRRWRLGVCLRFRSRFGCGCSRRRGGGGFCSGLRGRLCRLRLCPLGGALGGGRHRRRRGGGGGGLRQGRRREGRGGGGKGGRGGRCRSRRRRGVCCSRSRSGCGSAGKRRGANGGADCGAGGWRDASRSQRGCGAAPALGARLPGRHAVHRGADPRRAWARARGRPLP